MPLPIVQEQDLHTCAAETQGAANAKNEEGKESSLLGNRPLPSPRSFKSLTSTQHQPQPQTRIHKESFKKAPSDEGKIGHLRFGYAKILEFLVNLIYYFLYYISESDWDTDNTSSPAKGTNIAETETGMLFN